MAKDEDIRLYKKGILIRKMLFPLHQSIAVSGGYAYNDPVNMAGRHLTNELNNIKKKFSPLQKEDRRSLHEAQINIARTIAEGMKSAPVVYVSFGGKEVTGKKDYRQGRRTYNVTVGYMWNGKVFKELYDGLHEREYGDWFILKSEKVRVNIKNIKLYEVKAFHKGTGEKKDGYIAVTQGLEKNAGFLNWTPNAAVKAAQRHVAKQIKLILKGTENDERT